MKYSEFLKKVNTKEDKSQEQKDLEAVKKDGNALQFVTPQTPEICLEAVKQYGYALQFVKKDIFDKED